MAAEINNYVNDTFLQYLYVLDSTYTKKAIIDTFSDFIWTERYYGYGEFEIKMPVNREVLRSVSIDDYVMIEESERLMIVETIGLTETEMTISGKSLESLVDRRILLDESIGTINDDGEPSTIGVQDGIKTMLTNNIISPSDSARKIPNFIFTPSSDAGITSLTMEAFEALGDSVYEKILGICKDKEIGFRVNAVDGGGYSFELYRGVDRTWDQDSVIPVIFSDSYENLTSSSYLQTETDYKSNVYMKWNWESEKKSTDPETGSEVTERETGSDVTDVYLNSNRSGLKRREAFTTDSTTYDIGANKNKSAAINQVTDKGKEYLSEYKTTEYFDGVTNPFRQFIYGVDYFLGDIVQLENRYGKTGKCRITEIAMARSSSGASMAPTFETMEGDD